MSIMSPPRSLERWTVAGSRGADVRACVGWRRVEDGDIRNPAGNSRGIGVEGWFHRRSNGYRAALLGLDAVAAPRPLKTAAGH